MRVAALLFLVACKHGQDCGAYAQKFVDTVKPAPERKVSTFGAEEDACENGRIDDKEYKCVMDAATPDDIFICQGLTPPPHS